MSFLSGLSWKSKIGWGILLSYTSFEVCLQARSKYVVYKRKQQLKTLNDDVSKFKSVTVAGMFVNPFEEYRPMTAFEFILVRCMELVESFYGNAVELHNKVPKNGKTVEVEDMLEQFKPDLEYLRENSALLHSSLANVSGADWSFRNNFTFTWLGQSCALLQMSGINIMTDPILGDHLISSHFGPKRLTKAPMTLGDIKYATNDSLDFVLVSHDHPDHLEMKVASDIGNTSTWIVPLGLKKKLARKGIFRVIEMDWWDAVSLNQFFDGSLPDEYEVVCLPAMHWSGRYVLDSNQSLWCSFMIRRNGESIFYHAGDTGYLEELFGAIAKKYGKLFFGLLPIGQYCPLWHQKPRHISPAESLKISNLLSTKYMMGVHWGTFKLSSEPILEPRDLLLKLSKEQGTFPRYKTPESGRTYLYDLELGTETIHEGK